MDRTVNKIATAVGAALIGLALAQPAAAQRDPASGSGISQTQPSGPNPANVSCDGLQGIDRENCLARRSSPSVTEGAAPSSGRADSPATSQRESAQSERDMRRDSAAAGTSERRGIFSRDREPGSASTGSSEVPRSERGRAADPHFQGANPANVFCDGQQGRARADCQESMSSGGALQQAPGAGD